MTVDTPTPALGRARLRPHATASGMLLAAAGAPFGIADSAGAGSLLEAPRWFQGAAFCIALMVMLAALSIVRYAQLGRVLTTAALLGVAALGTPQLVASPQTALIALVAGTGCLVLLWKVGAPLIEVSRVRERPVREGQAQGASMVALGLWLLWTFNDRERSLVDTLAVGWGVAWALLLSVEWAWANVARRRLGARLVLAASAAALLIVPVLWGNWWWIVSSFVGTAALTSLMARPLPRRGIEHTAGWDVLLGHPERLFVGTFAALCVTGALLLALPQSAASHATIGMSDALFTATSAVCVTGLVVLDTPVAFSGFGQFVILLLIQVGGLGIMTFSTAALWAFGQRLSLRHEGAVASLISTEDRGQLFNTAKRILLLTLAVEGIGALLLTLAFMAHGDGMAMALWRGVFTAVSAFCNAGFALQTQSLIPYQHSALVLHTVGTLIVLGGLSPLAVFALPAVLRRSPAPVSAQARLALSAAGVLILLGFVLILAFEWNASLGQLSFTDKLHNAWFQSVTLRTAGFNSVDISISHSATLLLMLIWMFIGGSPGGTAGGIKTTTLAVLTLSVVEAIRGRWTLEAFGRRIPERTQAKAAVVVSIAAVTGMLALFAVLLTQNMPTGMAVFEVVSALGTVGLSIGGTAELDGIGKAIIIVCMFVGRVGGLTLLMFLSNRRAPTSIGRPEEEIDVG